MDGSVNVALSNRQPTVEVGACAARKRLDRPRSIGYAAWMTVVLLRVAAWLSLAVIVVVTIGPIGLRPVSSATPDIERFAAFLVVGALFGAGYPSRIVLVVLLIILGAGLLELGQNFVANRHGLTSDFAVKAAAGVIGAIAGKLAAQMLQSS